MDAPWILITGENGDGKTSLLQALAIGLCGGRNASHLLDENQQSCNILVKLQALKSEKFFDFGIEFNDGYHTTILGHNLSSDNYFELSKKILGYGPSHLSIQGELSGERKETNPVYTLLHQSGNLYNVEPWLKDFELEARGDPQLQLRNRKRMDLLASLMPNVDRIEIRGSKVVYLEKGLPVPAHHLSSGHKSILAMIGDMLIRLTASQPDVDDAKDFQGIVLIDELETHLHPKWQVQFPKKLSEVFPKVQFIATTHSVIPFMGAPEGSVFLRVTRDQEHGTQVERLNIDVTRLLPNALLTSPLFELDSIVNQLKTSLDDVETEDSYPEIERRQALDQDLERYALENPDFLNLLTAAYEIAK